MSALLGPVGTASAPFCEGFADYVGSNLTDTTLELFGCRDPVSQVVFQLRGHLTAATQGLVLSGSSATQVPCKFDASKITGARRASGRAPTRGRLPQPQLRHSLSAGVSHNGRMESAEVVIVGGGAMGASTAFHLAQLGITDVVLLERDTLASGSTSKAAGGIRTQFADELNIRIALRSLDELESFEERVGVEIDFRQAGYLFLLDNKEDVERFQAALALQHSLSVPSRELSVKEAAAMIPQLQTADLLAATFCDLDGYATPEALVQGYAQAAAARGVRVRQGCTVERIVIERGRVLAVETSAGRIATDTIACCAGVWSRALAALAGVELPVTGEPRRMWFTPQDGGLPDPLPLTIDFSTGFYFHREGPGLAFGGREQTLEDLAGPIGRRLPLLAELPIQSSWWGYYELSPDYNALVGEAPEPRRFLYATGFSGHGFQQAPAVGEHLAELVVGKTPTLDLSPFSAERFARGAERREQLVV